MTPQLPGNSDALDGEIRRLDDMKGRLWSTGEAMRRLTIERWTGRARDAFEDFRYAFANQWLAAGDRHEDAARALERYHRTLLDLHRRAATADPTPADLTRWRQQLDSEAHAAATAIRIAADALAAMPRLLADPGSARTGSTPTPPTAPPRRARTLDPRAAHSDPAGFRERVRALCHDLAAAPVIVIGPA